MEFELIMQRPGMKDEFDTDFENWARAVIMYAQRNCTKNSAIQAVVNDVDLECEFVLALCLLMFLSQKCNWYSCIRKYNVRICR